MISIHQFTTKIGNQLFQIAAAYALAKDNNDEVAWPVWNNAHHFSGDFTPRTSPTFFLHQQRGHHYEPIPYMRNMAIGGYFQSEKYFQNYKSDILKIFWPKVYKPDLLTQDNSKTNVSLHVRRTDYIELKDHHPPLGMDYYEEAMSLMKSKYTDCKFIIFSDDVDYCKTEFSRFSDCFVAENSSIIDFCSMIHCNHHIIANSSFSWWAAYLSELKHNELYEARKKLGREEKFPKDVIAPADHRWFGPALSHLSMKDMYPEGWIKL